MKTDIELYELIENYLRDNLSPEEKFAFEVRISSDPELELSVEKHRQLIDFVEDGTLLEIRESIQRIHEEIPGTGNIITKGRIIFLSTILLLTTITLSILLLNNSRKKDSVAPAETIPNVDSTEREEPKPLFKDDTVVSSHEPKQPLPKAEPVENKRKDKAGENQMKSDALASSKKEEGKVSKSELDTGSNLDVTSNESDKGSAVKENTYINPVNPIQKDTVDCDTVVMQADVETEESCEERATGQMVIKVSSKKGAVPPYSISIDNGRNYQFKSIFNKLMPGNYIVWLKDNNNCLAKAGSYLISSVVCDYEFIFAPDKGERWKIPSQNQNGVVTIYSKQGTLVFTQRFEEGEIISWDGTSMNGIPQPMGVYRFILELNNEEPLVGNVTIVR